MAATAVEPRSLPAASAAGLRGLLDRGLPGAALLLAAVVRRPATLAVTALDRRRSTDLEPLRALWLRLDHGAPEPPGVVMALDDLPNRLADLFMGGPGKTSDRAPTHLELAVVARQLTVALASLPSADLSGRLADFAVRAVEPETLQIAPDLACATLTITAGDLTGSLLIGLPFAIVESDEAPPETVTASSELRDSLRELEVPVSIVFEALELPAAEVDRLAVGDVIRLDHRVGAPVTGVVDGKPVFAGRPGKRGRHLAVEVEHVLLDGAS